MRAAICTFLLLGTLTLSACGQTAAPTATVAAPAKPTTAAKPAAPPTAAPSAPTATARPRELVKIKYGGQAVASDAGLYIAMERGYFRDEGLEVSYERFGSASEITPALAASQIEVGGIGANAATLNAAAREITIKIVADKGSAISGFGLIAVVVRKDLFDSGAIREVKDLKGRSIAVTPPLNATATAVSLSRFLASAGLTEDDVEIKNLSYGDMNAALANGSVDAAIENETLVTEAVKQGIAVRFKGADEFYLNHQTGVVAYSPRFVKEQPEAAKGFMVAYLRGVRDYNDAFGKNKGRPEIIQILTKHTSIKDPAVYDSAVPSGLNPDGYVHLDSIAYDQEWFLKKGVVKTPVNLKELVDNQFVDYALQKLGKYAR